MRPASRARWRMACGPRALRSRTDAHRALWSATCRPVRSTRPRCSRVEPAARMRPRGNHAMSAQAPTVLERILESTREALESRKRELPLGGLEYQAFAIGGAEGGSPRRFATALT